MGEDAPEKLETLGLWGDGDELDALRKVEQRFGVKLDYMGAGSWFTAGDIYDDLLKELPQEAALSPDTWSEFARAISDETGVDPLRVAPETLLFDQSRSWPRSIGVMIALVVIGCAIVFWPW